MMSTDGYRFVDVTIFPAGREDRPLSGPLHILVGHQDADAAPVTACGLTLPSWESSVYRHTSVQSVGSLCGDCFPEGRRLG